MVEINQIYNMDCLEGMKLIDDKSIDMILCDLPYFQVAKESWDNNWNELDDYLHWVELNLVEYNRILKDNSNLFLFTGRQYNRYISILLDKYFIEKRIIIWARKRAFNNTRGRTLTSGYEPLCWYSKGKESIYNNMKIKSDSRRKEYTTGILKDGICISDVWGDIPALPHNSKEKTSHSTQKPLKLIERIVKIGSDDEYIVLDNCIGSGTTAIACIKTNRNFIGFELNKEYFNIANKRIEAEKSQLKLI